MESRIYKITSTFKKEHNWKKKFPTVWLWKLHGSNVLYKSLGKRTGKKHRSTQSKVKPARRPMIIDYSQKSKELFLRIIIHQLNLAVVGSFFTSRGVLSTRQLIGCETKWRAVRMILSCDHVVNPMSPNPDDADDEECIFVENDKWCVAIFCLSGKAYLKCWCVYEMFV